MLKYQYNEHQILFVNPKSVRSHKQVVQPFSINAFQWYLHATGLFEPVIQLLRIFLITG